MRESTPRVLINREPVKHISFDAELLGDADEIVQQLCHRLEWDSPVDSARSDLSRPLRPRVVPLDELSPLPSREDVERVKAGVKGKAMDGDEAARKSTDEPGTSASAEESSSNSQKNESSSKEDEKDNTSKDAEGSSSTNEGGSQKNTNNNSQNDEDNTSKDENNSQKNKNNVSQKDDGDGFSKDAEGSPMKESPLKSERHEFEEPCPLFGSRCRCPMGWNIANFLPGECCEA